MAYNENLAKELKKIEEYRDPQLTPPIGVNCDCLLDDNLKDNKHFHVRVMSAECDNCGKSFKSYFHAYTKAEGYDMLVMEARGLGWSVDENSNYYLCPQCMGDQRN